jgi:lauroyl/myristoyl acyltransferase
MHTQARIPPVRAPRWVEPKDAAWAAYLVGGRWLAQASPTALRRLLGLSEPLLQRLARRRRDHLAGKLVAARAEVRPDEAEDFARAFMAKAVRRAGDDLVLAAGTPALRCTSLRGREHLDAARSAGKGVILASLHWYAARAAKRYLAAIGCPVLTVRNGRPWSDCASRLGRRWLEPKYVDLLHRIIRDEVLLQEPDCTLKILARLRTGGMVDLHLDAPLSAHTLRLPFLGRERAFPTGLFHLARLSGAAVLPLIVRGHAGALDIEFGAARPLDRALPGPALAAAGLPPLVRLLEEHVLQHPAEWDLWTRQ